MSATSSMIDGGQARSDPQPRPWEWIYNSLWSACGRHERESGCTLNIPDTVLFLEGEPRRWLTNSSEGKIIRESFNRASTRAESSRRRRRPGASRALGNEQTIRDNLVTIRESFLRFQLSSQFDSRNVNRGGSMDGKGPLCVAWYTDGGTELLDAATLDMLGRHKEWRMQLMALQAYVHPKRIEHGVYDGDASIDPNFRFDQRDGMGRNSALDILARALAEYAQTAYMIDEKERERPPPRGVGVTNADEWPTSRIKILSLTAEFIVDDNNKLWFSHTTELIAQAIQAERERAMVLEREEQRATLDSAETVASELRRLLRMAAQRGVGIASSFGHFDLQGVGYVDVHDLEDGLGRLGIGVTEPAAEVLMGMIGQASGLHFRAQDLEVFASEEEFRPDDDDDGGGGGGGELQPDDDGYEREQERKRRRRQHRDDPDGILVTGEYDFEEMGDGLWGPGVGGPRPFEEAREPYASRQSTRAGLGTALSGTSSMRTRTTTRGGSRRRARAGEEPRAVSASSLSQVRRQARMESDQPHYSDYGSEDGVSPARPGTTVSMSRRSPSPQPAFSADRGPPPGWPDPSENLNSPPAGYKDASQRQQERQRARTSEALPQWARESSKRALKQLKRREQAWKRHQAQLALVGQHDSDTEDSEEERERMRDQERRQKREKEDASSSSISQDPRDRPGSGWRSAGPRHPVSRLNLGSVIEGSEEDSLDGGTKLNRLEDQFYHVDSDTIMSYRLLNGAAVPEPSQVPGSSVLQESAAMSAAAEVLKILEQHPPTEFMLVVVPDMFQTLETLKEAFLPLVAKHAKGRVLLVGLPGLPRTHWAEGATLNNELHALCISRLLEHLQRRGDWVPDRQCPLLFVGIGNGANALTLFAASHLPAPRHSDLRRATRLVVLMNGFVHVDKPLRRTLVSLRRSIRRSDHHERIRHLTSLLFSEEYLGHVTRGYAMEKFWATRHDMTALTQSPDEQEEDDAQGGGGTHALIQGMLDHVDVRPLLPAITVPLLLVMAAQNAFIPPLHAESFATVRGELVHSPRDTVREGVPLPGKHGNVHVVWLKGGHEVLQERQSFVLSLMSKLIVSAAEGTLAGEEALRLAEEAKNRIPTPQVDERANLQGFLDVLADVDLPQGDKLGAAADVMAAASAEQKLSDYMAPSSSGSEDEEDGGSDDDFTLGSSLTHESEASMDRSKAQEKKRARRAKELRMKKKRAEEKKKRKREQERQQELKMMKMQQMLEEEAVNESRQRLEMSAEDFRSRLAEDYQNWCVEWEKKAEIARERTAELQAAREETEIKQLEAEMARQRAARHEARKRRLEEMKKKYEADELVMDGQASGGYFLDPKEKDVKKVSIGATRLLSDLLQARARNIDALKRQKMVEEKTNMFQDQVDKTDSEVRSILRTLRLAETGGAFSVIGTTKRESKALEEKQKELQNQLTEFVSLLRGSQEMLAQANRSCQELKKVVKKKEDEVIDMMDKLMKMERNLNNHMGLLRMRREVASTERVEVQEVLRTSEARLTIVRREMRRIANHKGRTVDTDVWQSGVVQRAKTADLREHLLREAMTLEVCIDDFQETEEVLQMRERGATKEMKTVSKDVDAISAMRKKVLKAYDEAMERTIQEELASQMEEEESAEQKAMERKAVAQRDKVASEQGLDSRAARVRHKESEQRTEAEKKWVAMDLLVNPELYLHVTELEAEEMKFDDAYQMKITKEDVERLLKLPEQIQLALPFLHTPHEVSAHRLLHTYTSEKGPDFFREQDAVMQEDPELLKFRTAEGVAVTAAEARKAEFRLELLLRERRGARVRSRVASELSKDERDWLQMDTILYPHMYPQLGEEILAEIWSGSVPRSIQELKIQQEEAAAAEAEEERLKALESGSDSSRPNTPASRPARDDGSTTTAIVASAATKSKKDPSWNGDRWQSARDRFMMTGSYEVQDQMWVCPFDRVQLLELIEAPIQELVEPEERRMRVLLDTYNVPAQHTRHAEQRRAALAGLEEEARLVEEGLTSPTGTPSTSVGDIKTAAAGGSGGGGDGNDDGSGGGKAASPHGNDDSDKKNKDSAESEKLPRRVWGGWGAVHPASAGAKSQTVSFDIAHRNALHKQSDQSDQGDLSSFNIERDHPASYCRPGAWAAMLAGTDQDTQEDETLQVHAEREKKQSAGLRILSKNAGPAGGKGGFGVDHGCIVLQSVSELADMSPAKVKKSTVLVNFGEMNQLVNESGLHLEPSQSRSHRFELPRGSKKHALDITATIVFQGVFGPRGYTLGRMAAAMYRLPDSFDGDEKSAEASGQGQNDSGIPIPIGFSDHEKQSLNTADAMGRIVVQHAPRSIPVHHGAFQVVVGAAAATRYSIVVEARVADHAQDVADVLYNRALGKQERYPVCVEEIEELYTSMRLTERKLRVVQGLMDEAEAESLRCEKEMEECNQELVDDDENMELEEEEREEIFAEMRMLEVEFSHWCRLFTTRAKEKKDVQEGIHQMAKLRLDRVDEKAVLTKDLEELRKDVPAAYEVLGGAGKAVSCALALNTSFTAKSAHGRWAAVAALKDHLTSVMTPAEELRRTFQRDGWKSLTLEEQQWITIDRVVKPEKYRWLLEQEADEDRTRAAKGKRPKRRRLHPLVAAFQYEKEELRRIVDAPYSQLQRRELVVRKLMARYHDNAGQLRDDAVAGGAKGFDQHMAARTRAKQERSRTAEEKEWASVDLILHPETWASLTRKDGASDFFDSAAKSSEIQSASAGRAGAAPKQIKKLLAEEAESSDSDVENSPAKRLSPLEAKKRQQAARNKFEKMQKNKADRKAGRKVDDDDGEDGDDEKENTSPTKKSLFPGGGGGGLGGMKSLLKKARADAEDKLAPSEMIKDGHWRCTFDKEELLRIWATPQHLKSSLKTEDEQRTLRLLNRFNGSHPEYVKTNEEHNVKKAAAETGPGLIQFDKLSGTLDVDVDARCRVVLRELDRAIHNSNEFMDSGVLHVVAQRFPTPVLRLELERELDRLLREQVYERERASKFLVGDSDEDDSDVSTDDEEERQRRREQKREEKRKEERLARSENSVQDARKRIRLDNKTDAERELAREADALGFGGCLACKKNPCEWKACVDVPKVKERRQALSDEINYVREHPDEKTMESLVSLSTLRTGNPIKMRRVDLLQELVWEDRELDRQLKLNGLDRELHDSYATRKEYMETKELHGYMTLLWTSNARRALERERNRVIAHIVTVDVIDDILEWMLEGWYFGERESEHTVMGYVPSLKPGGFIRHGHDMRLVEHKVKDRVKEREDRWAKGEKADSDEQGTPLEKWEPIELTSMKRGAKEKVVKAGGEHDHILNETENTLKFGQFCVTLMYFRAMTLVKREHESWSGKNDAVGMDDDGDKKKQFTQERRRMMEEKKKADLRQRRLKEAMAKARVGEERKRLREEKERAEAARRLYEKMRLEKRERAASLVMERFYRGHLGRKAAKRWAMKKAEMEAMNALMTASAITMQRVYRGHLGRSDADEKRLEMAEFIATIRAEEAAADEEEYWRTHTFARLKRNARNFVHATVKRHQEQKELEMELEAEMG